MPGFNVRSTDLQAVIGLQQIEGLRPDKMVRARCNIFNQYAIRLPAEMWKPLQHPEKTLTSAFAYPVIFESKEVRNQVAKNLRNNDIEVRPIICGSMGEQPFYKMRYGEAILNNAHRVKECGLYLPIYPELTGPEIDKICDIIKVTLE